jgi:hypothetical protein
MKTATITYTAGRTLPEAVLDRPGGLVASARVGVGLWLWLFLVAAGLCCRVGPGSSWSARRAAPAGAGEDERA